MKTTINYKLQDDIIGRQKRRVDNKHKHDQELLYHIQQEVLSGDDGAAQQTVKELQSAGANSGTDKDKQEEAKDLIEDAKLNGPRDLIRVMQANTRNPFVQSRGCAALAEIAAFSMRQRHSRHEGMFTFHRGTEVAPVANMNISLGKMGALTCVLQALVKHRANKIVVWRSIWACQHMIKSPENKDIFLQAGGVPTVKNVIICHENDVELTKELNNTLILAGASRQTWKSQLFDGPVDTSKPSGCYWRGHCMVL